MLGEYGVAALQVGRLTRFEGDGDLGMKGAAAGEEQAAVGDFVDQRVFELVGRGGAAGVAHQDSGVQQVV